MISGFPVLPLSALFGLFHSSVLPFLALLREKG
jgi:hypothetical protein